MSIKSELRLKLLAEGEWLIKLLLFLCVFIFIVNVAFSVDAEYIIKLYNKGFYKDVIEEASSLSPTEIRLPEIAMVIAESYYQLGRYSEALKWYKRVYDKFAQYKDWARYGLVWCYWNLKKYDKVVELADFSRPDECLIYFSSLIKLKRYKEVVEDFEKWCSLEGVSISRFKNCNACCSCYEEAESSCSCCLSKALNGLNRASSNQKKVKGASKRKVSKKILSEDLSLIKNLFEMYALALENLKKNAEAALVYRGLGLCEEAAISFLKAGKYKQVLKLCLKRDKLVYKGYAEFYLGDYIEAAKDLKRYFDYKLNKLNKVGGKSESELIYLKEFDNFMVYLKSLAAAGKYREVEKLLEVVITPEIMKLIVKTHKTKGKVVFYKGLKLSMKELFDVVRLWCLALYKQKKWQVFFKKCSQFTYDPEIFRMWWYAKYNSGSYKEFEKLDMDTLLKNGEYELAKMKAFAVYSLGDKEKALDLFKKLVNYKPEVETLKIIFEILDGMGATSEIVHFAEKFQNSNNRKIREVAEFWLWKMGKLGMDALSEIKSAELLFEAASNLGNKDKEKILEKVLKSEGKWWIKADAAFELVRLRLAEGEVERAENVLNWIKENAPSYRKNEREELEAVNAFLKGFYDFLVSSLETGRASVECAVFVKKVLSKLSRNFGTDIKILLADAIYGIVKKVVKRVVANIKGKSVGSNEVEREREDIDSKLVDSAVKLLKTRECSKFNTWLVEFLKSVPESKKVLFCKGVVLEAAGNLKKAAENYFKLWVKYDVSGLRDKLVNLYKKIGDIDKASKIEKNM